MGSLLITDCKLVLPDSCKPGELSTEDGKITAVSTHSSQPARQDTKNAYSAGGCYAAPGLIDLHVQGFSGIDLRQTSSPEAIREMEQLMLPFGATSYVATLAYDSDTLKNVAKHMGTPSGGAKLLGTYLEGPFINPERMGAIPKQYCYEPSLDLLDRILDEAQGSLRLMTVAPELEGNIEIIQQLARAGTTPAIGHTLCTYEEALEGFRAGIRHTTHLFNAMTGITHRMPGAAGAALTSDDVTVELIADGIHIHPSVIRLALAVKTRSLVAIITDAISAAGISNGNHVLMGERVQITDGAPRLSDGTLAGSIVTPIQALKNTVTLAGVPLHDAVFMLSATPAKIIGFDHRKGTLEEGKDADIIIFDDDFNMKAAFVGGKLVWERGNETGGQREKSATHYENIHSSR